MPAVVVLEEEVEVVRVAEQGALDGEFLDVGGAGELQRLGGLEVGGGGEVEVVAVGEEFQGLGGGRMRGGAEEDRVQAYNAGEAVFFVERLCYSSRF